MKVTRAQVKNVLRHGLPLLALSIIILPLIDGLAQSVGVAVGQPAVTYEHPQFRIASVSPWVLLAIVIPLAVVEEWIFRGWLLNRLLMRSNWKTWNAITAAAGFFAFMHIFNPGTGWLGLLSPFAAGIIFGYAYLRAGLACSAFVHGGFNSYVVLMMVML